MYCFQRLYADNIIERGRDFLFNNIDDATKMCQAPCKIMQNQENQAKNGENSVKNC